jgi:signal transduction histidine kinase
VSEELAKLDIHFRSPDALAVLLTLAQTVPLVWRRRVPGAVLAVTGLAALGHMALGYRPTWAEFGVLIALYTVAARRPWRQSVLAAVLVAAGLAVYAVIATRRLPPSPPQETVQGWVVSYVQFAGAWFLGNVQRKRLAYTAKLEALNAQLAQEQELRSRWAVAEERGRIARELHDVVAHSVSVMVVQAGAARRSVAISPDLATTPLGQIESTGRQALTELRRLLGLLRDGEEPGAALVPQPSLAHLESLVAAAREAGLPVAVVVEGEPGPLPAGVDLSAYRIVQGALTNLLKHAGPARASVRVCYGREVLEIQVWDDGTGRNGQPAEGGHGLIGMRERVALFGGSLEVGARPGGGFRVAARLPVDGEVRGSHA